LSEKITGDTHSQVRGFGIRILGDVTADKVEDTSGMDYIFIQGLKDHGLLRSVWQAGAILFPINSVGRNGGPERLMRKLAPL